MKKHNAWSWVAAALALAGMATGCGSKTVDIGDGRDPALTGASLTDYRGTWVGRAELAVWSDGTGDVRLELDEQGNGVFEVGLAPPLEPPVAHDGYPRDFEYAATSSWPLGAVPGFSYPIVGAVVESNRIRLQTSSAELFREYCDLQTPMPVELGSPSGFNCTGFVSYSGSGAPGSDCTPLLAGDVALDPIDCDWLVCMSVCTCDANDCHAERLDWGADIRLDAALENEGEELVGSLEIPQGILEPRIYRVVMTRE